MTYEKHTCDLIISSSTKDVYRLNLEQGRFLQPYTTSKFSLWVQKQETFSNTLLFVSYI